jgi:predicted metalloprotease with PDZ domain
MLMAGLIKRAPDPPSGAFSAVWTGEPTFDVRAAMDWTSKLHHFMSHFFADPVERPYYIFLHAHLSGNGVAATQAFVLGITPKTTVESVQSMLGHEMTHTWTTADLPKWYTEGDAVYYQTLLPWRAGLMPIEKRLADINLTTARYYTNDAINAPDSDILPKFWSDMRYNVLPYDRGAIYFAVLDGKIRRASGGKRSVDDLVRAMVALGRDEKKVSEETWIDFLRKELGEEGPAVHQAMMSGRKLVPESGDYGPCFRRISAKIARYDLGFGGPEITKRSVVENLRPDSNAAKAGLKEGDRLQYQTSTEGAQRDPNMPLTMQVTRDGKTLEVTYLPRGEMRDAYQWERIPGVPAEACRETSGSYLKPAK